MSSSSLTGNLPVSLARLVLPVALPRLARVVVPLWVSLVMATLFLATAIDWRGLSDAVASQRPGPLAAVVVAGWAWATRRSFLPVLAARPLAALVRQPVGPFTWSLVLLPVLVAAALPVALVPLLAGRPGEIPAWLLAGGLGVVAASPAGPAGFVGALAAGALAGGVADLPPIPGLVAATAGYLLLAGRLWTRALRVGSLLRPSIPGRPSSPLIALIRLDLLAALRQGSGTLLGGYLAGALVLAWLAVAVRGGLSPEALPIAVPVLAALAMAGPLVALGEAWSRRPLLDPPWWPVSPWRRAVALVASTFLVCLPLGLVEGLLVARPGALARTLLTALALAGAGALVGAWAPRRAVNIGLLVLLAFLVVPLAQLPWPLPLLDLGAAAVATALLAHRLARRRRPA